MKARISSVDALGKLPLVLVAHTKCYTQHQGTKITNKKATFRIILDNLLSQVRFLGVE